MAHYSRALDEVYSLRVLLARELVAVKRFQEFVTLPQGVRKGLAEQQARIELALRGGGTAMIHRFVRSGEAQQLLREAGTRETLTRGLWEKGEHLHVN